MGDFIKVRVSKLTGMEIPKPPPPKRERKGKKMARPWALVQTSPPQPSFLAAGELDTLPKDALAETFVPSLQTPPIPKDCIL